MTEQEIKKAPESQNKPAQPSQPAQAAQSAPQPGQGRGRQKINRRRGGRRPQQDRRRREEFAEQVVDLRRVTRVMAGGKRFRFRATLIIGDRKGRVGVGVGKGADVAQAIQKAKSDAKKKLIQVHLNKKTIPHEVEAKYSAAKVFLKPTPEGNGLVAGGAVRTVLSLAGVHDIAAKCIGRTSNKLTNALATIEALKQLKPARKSKKQDKKEVSKKENKPAAKSPSLNS
ncbi:MAG: 30S ribosomal protein S5 [Candidatus Harrisonbacteria bacterium CG10_big_fil_rev_8_21_14_0_10_44_23]|uniref:Small ribosomal subunit protein uS5 n=1 Tax=Candidatus Harrisonbacteria bacterium CG10_big_fil_rev_8_21_14_0_10_44_23 TaxID=1974585 RepID=A0A2H0UQI9_9BACT|nr:MAG: 30S ribosomal protein S5 [Candidatus Harrisonbacteria bacterium CG10_big_fil_rev_8_21_14_0_10_44_23]